MTKNNKNIVIKQAQDFVISSLKECKLRTIIMGVSIVIMFITGIIVAARTHSDFGTIENFGVYDIRTGGLSSTFLTRLFSMFFVYLVMFGCSFFDFLFPIAVILISYRSYLLGLNILYMIIFYGFSGVLLSVIIAFPCQIVILLLLALFYILLARTTKDKKCFGSYQISRQREKICLICALALFVVCLCESLLLFLFSAKVILVI